MGQKGESKEIKSKVVTSGKREKPVTVIGALTYFLPFFSLDLVGLVASYVLAIEVENDRLIGQMSTLFTVDDFLEAYAGKLAVSKEETVKIILGDQKSSKEAESIYLNKEIIQKILSENLVPFTIGPVLILGAIYERCRQSAIARLFTKKNLNFLLKKYFPKSKRRAVVEQRLGFSLPSEKLDLRRLEILLARPELHNEGINDILKELARHHPIQVRDSDEYLPDLTGSVLATCLVSDSSAKFTKDAIDEGRFRVALRYIAAGVEIDSKYLHTVCIYGRSYHGSTEELPSEIMEQLLLNVLNLPNGGELISQSFSCWDLSQKKMSSRTLLEYILLIGLFDNDNRKLIEHFIQKIPSFVLDAISHLSYNDEARDKRNKPGFASDILLRFFFETRPDLLKTECFLKNGYVYNALATSLRLGNFRAADYFIYRSSIYRRDLEPLAITPKLYELVMQCQQQREGLKKELNAASSAHLKKSRKLWQRKTPLVYQELSTELQEKVARYCSATQLLEVSKVIDIIGLLTESEKGLEKIIRNMEDELLVTDKSKAVDQSQEVKAGGASKQGTLLPPPKIQSARVLESKQVQSLDMPEVKLLAASAERKDQPQHRPANDTPSQNISLRFLQ